MFFIFVVCLYLAYLDVYHICWGITSYISFISAHHVWNHFQCMREGCSGDIINWFYVFSKNIHFHHHYHYAHIGKVSDVNVYLIERNWLMNVNILVKYFFIANHFLGKWSFDVMTAYRLILPLGEKKDSPTTHISQAVGSDGANTDAQSFIPLPRPDILFIHHTSSIRSLIHVQDKTTAKLLDYREKRLRHLSRWWKQRRPLTFAGSRSITSQVRQRVPTPLMGAVCTLRSTASPVN